MAKWDNLLSILWMLRGGKKLTAAQLADSLEISIRTVYRYIDALCASGVPIVAEPGHDGGFRILENFQETPLFFHVTELRAMVNALKFAQGAGYPYADEFASTLQKIERNLNFDQIHDLYHQTRGLDVISPARPPFVVQLLRQLEQAIADGHTLRISYRKPNSESASERNIDPYGLAYRRSEWYLVAYCHSSREIRTFRVDRITSLEPTEASFQKPEDFSVNEYFRLQSHRSRLADGPMTLIRITGDPISLNTICSHWHLQHFLTERTDQEAHFLLDFPTMNKYLPVYLMTFGTSIEVLEPLGLRRQIRELAARVVRHYADDSESTSIH